MITMIAPALQASSTVGRAALSIAKPVAVVTGHLALEAVKTVAVTTATFLAVGITLRVAGITVDATKTRYAKTIRYLHNRLPA